MIFKSTDEFFKLIANDYKGRSEADNEDIKSNKENCIDTVVDVNEKRVRKSFLYKYFKDKKDIDARVISRDKDLLFEYRKPKTDKYTLLRGAFMAYKKGVISDEDYKELFLEANACSKSGQKKREKLFETNPKEARKLLEDRLLRDCAERFIDNAQRRQNNSNIDVIEMLSKYSISENNVSKPSAGAPQADFSEEYIRKCAKLYENILSANGMDNVVIPLYIDKATGAGIYIIGNKHFGGDTPGVFILSFCDINMDNVDLPDIVNVEMAFIKYNSVEKAFDDFNVNVSNGIYFEDYHFYNDKLPAGADSCFSDFFYDSEQASADEEAVIKSQKKE